MSKDKFTQFMNEESWASLPEIVQHQKEVLRKSGRHTSHRLVMKIAQKELPSASMVAHLKDGVLIVSGSPGLNQELAMSRNLPVRCREFNGLDILEYSARIIQVFDQPDHLIFLQKVVAKGETAQRLRNTVRVNTCVLCVAKHKTSSYASVILDMSTGGGLLAIPRLPEEEFDSVTLQIPVISDVGREEIEIPANIRRREIRKIKNRNVYFLGLSFDDITPTGEILLMHLMTGDPLTPRKPKKKTLVNMTEAVKPESKPVNGNPANPALDKSGVA